MSRNNQISTFNFNNNALTVLDDGTQPLFVAKEVAVILGYSAAEAMTRRLDDDEKLIRQIVVSGQNRDVLLINESGLYSSIIGSNKPEAKAFKKWITAEVLPTLRKTGQYTLKGKTNSTPHDLFVKNHKAASLLFTDRNSRLRYANQLTLEQTGVDILAQTADFQPPALKELLNTQLVGGTVKQLLDAVQYQQSNYIQAAQLLLSQFITLKNGVITIGNKCPLVTDRAALKAVPSAIYKVAHFKGTGAVKSILIPLY